MQQKAIVDKINEKKAKRSKDISIIDEDDLRKVVREEIVNVLSESREDIEEATTYIG